MSDTSTLRRFLHTEVVLISQWLHLLAYCLNDFRSMSARLAVGLSEGIFAFSHHLISRDMELLQGRAANIWPQASSGTAHHDAN